MTRRLWRLPKFSPQLGLGFWQIQMLLLGIAAAVSGLYWLLQGNTNPTTQVLSTFIIGNCNWLAVLLAAPLIKQKSPWDLIAYLGVLLPVAAVASWISLVASRMVLGRAEPLLALDWSDIRNGMFFSLVSGVAFLFREKLGRGSKGGIASWKSKLWSDKSSFRHMKPS